MKLTDETALDLDPNRYHVFSLDNDDEFKHRRSFDLSKPLWPRPTVAKRGIYTLVAHGDTIIWDSEGLLVEEELEALDGFEVCSVNYEGRDEVYSHRGFFDSYRLAVAEAKSIAKAEDAWMQVTHGEVILRNNGNELDDEGLRLAVRVVLKHMAAQGWLTEPNAEGGRSLTAEGRKMKQQEMLRHADPKSRSKH